MRGAVNTLNALIGYGLLLALPPVGLVWMAGLPLPATAPGRDELLGWLEQPLTFDTIETLFVVTGWLAWAFYSVAILAYAYTWTVRRLRLPRLMVPRPVEAMAAAVLGTAAAAAATGAADASTATVAGTGATAGHSESNLPTIGTPSTADGSNAPPTQHRTGGRPLAVYTVAKSDRLWTVAARLLGDPRRYVDIAAVNPQLERADARFPDHIEPGQRIRVPAGARDGGRRPHATGTLTASTPADRPTPSTRPQATPEPAPTASGPRAEPSPAPLTTSQAPTAAGNSSRLDGLLPAAAVLAAGSVLAALLVHHLRHRGRYRPRPRPDPSREQTPARPPIRTVAPAVEVDRLGRALRVLAAGLRDRKPADLPDITAAWVSSGGIDLILASPGRSAPIPFVADANGLTWSLPAHSSIGPVDGTAAPLPLLASVGSSADGHLLLDLERTGLFAINGDHAAGVDLLRYLAAELATNQWSDHMRIVLAGFNPEDVEHLAKLGARRITVAESVASAITEARDRITDNAAALADDGSPSAFAARTTDPEGADKWTPQILLIADTTGHEDELNNLNEDLAHAGPCAVAVAAVTALVTTWRATVTADGDLRIEWLTADNLATNRLAPDQLATLADLVERARVNESPDEGQQQTGTAPPAAVTAPSTILGKPTAGGQSERAKSGSGGDFRPPRRGLAEAPRTAPAPGPPPPDPRGTQPSSAFLLRVGDQASDDPELDADLDAWHATDTRRPRIGVLGPIHVRACGTPPAERQRFCTELIVYLAQRGYRGATGEQIEETLWPDQAVNPRTRRVALSKVRRWLGRDSQGEPWLPHNLGHDRVYRLNPATLTDWDLFQRLSSRARTRPEGAADDLRRALDLVRGEPLAGATIGYPAGQRVPFSWLPQSSIQPFKLASAVVDAAHDLADLSLAAGDTITARWAVERAWAADPARSHDQTWIDAIRVADAEGRRAELRTLLIELFQAREVEVPEDLTPSTYAAVQPFLDEVT